MFGEFYTIRVWYIPYAYGTYHTRMVCFSVPYAYGCTVCVYVSHSIKLSIGARGPIQNAYYVQKAMSIIASASLLAQYILIGL